MKNRRPSFQKWLRSQTQYDESDAIGRLRIDYIRDCRRSGVADLSLMTLYGNILMAHNSTAEETLKLALLEYALEYL